MIPDEKEITDIIQNNMTDNLICRALEMRPEEITKYICGLANVAGGYVLIGAEIDNGILKVLGFQLAFDMKTVMDAVAGKLKGNILFEYRYVRVLGKNVYAIKVDKAEQNVLLNNIFYCYKNNGVAVCQTSKENPSTLFISYTECDAPIVDIIEKKISEKLQNKIRISRYTGLEYKDSFKVFMDTIQDHDFVLTVVSDTYLRRQACMYEVGEIIKDHHYKDKLLFVVLTEKERKYYGKNAPEKIEADIYKGAVSKLEYTRYWQKKYEELEEAMKQINDYEATRQATYDLQIIGQIYRKDIGEFLQFLSDENGKSFQKLYDNNFEELVKWIYPRYKSNIFDKCDCFDVLLHNTIERLHCITKTDYNQIALGIKTDSHMAGLMVFADDIVEHKQRYRLVVMDGLMARSYVTGNCILVNDVKKEPGYFCAVFQTKSEVVLPIKHGEKVIGVFNSESEEKNYYNQEMIIQLEKVLGDFADKMIELGYVGNMAQNDVPYVHISI